MYTLTHAQFQEILGAIAFAKGYFRPDAEKYPVAKWAVERLTRAADTMIEAANQ